MHGTETNVFYVEIKMLFILKELGIGVNDSSYQEFYSKDGNANEGFHQRKITILLHLPEVLRRRDAIVKTCDLGRFKMREEGKTRVKWS